jgi:hypothetical protein
MPSFSSAAQDCIMHECCKSAEVALQYIMQDRLDESDSDKALELFQKAKIPMLRIAALIWLAKNNKHCYELGQLLGFEPSELRSIPHSSPKEAMFPVIGASGKAYLAKAIVFIIPSKISRAVAIFSQRITEYNHLSVLSRTSCIIGFDTAVEGDSWQLAVLAALLSKTGGPGNLAFSGIVQADSEIKSADGLEAKQDCCLQHGLRLVHRVRKASHLDAWINQSVIPIPVLQFNGSESECKHWQQTLQSSVQDDFDWFSYDALEDFFGISKRDLSIGSKGDMAFDTKVWQDFLETKVLGFFAALEQRLIPKKIIWFYAGQISSLQFGIGAIFGFKRAIAILQLEFSSTTYRKVFALYGKQNARELKNVSIKSEEKIMIESELQVNNPENKELGLILYFGSHNPIGEAKDFCLQFAGVENFLVMRARDNQGTIETKDNWLRWIQEINSELNRARENFHWKRIHLFQTAPTSLCMALGIAIGHFLPIQIYHYQFNASEPKYRAVYSMQQVFHQKKDHR